MNIIPTLERKGAIVAAKPDRHTPMRAIAENLDRRLYDQAHIELVTESLHRLAELVYQTDRAGWVNVDPATGRILVPVPWGKVGRRMWGLYPSEGITLGRILRSRQRRAKTGPIPLFRYDSGRRTWRIDLEDYPTLTTALDYLRRNPIGVQEWRCQYDTGKGKR